MSRSGRINYIKNTKEKQNKLGLFPTVTIIIGGMIGSAIFSLSGLVMWQAGPASILSYIIAALIMLCYGLICAELSCRFKNSGGVYVFPAKSLGKTKNQGKFWGWLTFWGFINSNIVAIAFSAIYVGAYLSVGFPQLSNMQIPLALISIIFVFVLNVLKISSLGKFNNAFVVALIITMLVFVFVALTNKQWESSLLTPFFTQGTQGTLGFMSSIPIVMVSYGAITSAAFIVKDIKNPKRNVPRAMIIALIFTCLLYVLIILSTLGLLTSQYLNDNPDMRYIPLFAAAFTKLSSIPWLSKLISISAFLALLTTMLVIMSINSRAICAVANDSLLPKALAKCNKNHVPLNATFLVVLISCVIACFPDVTQMLVNLGVLFSVVVIIMICISVIYARKNNPQKCDFNAPLGKFLPVATLIILIICNITNIFSGNIDVYLFTIIWYILGIIYFCINQKIKAKHKLN